MILSERKSEAKGEENCIKRDKAKSKPLFEATYGSHQKLDYFQTLSSVNDEEFDPFPSPEKFNENVDAFDEKIKEETYHQLLAAKMMKQFLSSENGLRKNYAEIEEKLEQYNKEHGTTLSFEVKNKKRIRRHEALEQYQTLLALFPEAPWVDEQAFTDHYSKRKTSDH